MTVEDALRLLQGGGALACAVIALWAVFTGRVVTRREFDELQARYDKVNGLNDAANEELRKQSTTNARLVELSLLQRQEAENIRLEPQKRRSTDV